MMKLKVLGVLLTVLFIPFQTQACVKTQVLEDITLPGQKSGEGYQNMMSIPQGLDALCTLQTLSPQLWQEAHTRLDFQEDLIPLLVQDGELRPNQVRHYKGFFKDMRANLISCEKEAELMRRRSRRPEEKQLVRLTIRPNNIIDVYYLFREGGAIRKHIVSHKIWFGRIIEQDGYNLCQTELP